MKTSTRIFDATWILTIMIILTVLPSAFANEEPDDIEHFFQTTPEINTLIGASSQSIAIGVPPGRSGIQPDLSFAYNSYRYNGSMGAGWEIHIGFIQRRTKKVANYNKEEFDLVSDTGKVELVPTGNNYFRSRIETTFTKYYYNEAGDYWIATHRDGTKYYFGHSPSMNSAAISRQTNSYGTFKWGLAEVQDLSGNYMVIEYFSDRGQIYPSQILYTGNSQALLSPSNIVVFEYGNEDRPDTMVSYISRKKVVLAKRLSAVKTYTTAEIQGDTPSLTYLLEYEQSLSNSASLLKRIRIIGDDGITEIPGYDFT